MRNQLRRSILSLSAALCALTGFATAGELVLEVRGGDKPITKVGALRRWDRDGNPRVPVDPKAKIDAPRFDAEARQVSEGRWLFSGLPEGRYDLVILIADRLRVEGFHYPPVAEFEPFLNADAPAPDDDDRATILKDIAQSRHYENKVVPLYLAGDAKQVRVLMQLVRDQPTSYDGEVGYPVATVRHEVWQYTNRYGTWVKELATRVFDRVLLPKDEFHRWTWVWEPALGSVDVKNGTVRREYNLPERFDAETAKGWFPVSASAKR